MISFARVMRGSSLSIARKPSMLRPYHSTNFQLACFQHTYGIVGVNMTANTEKEILGQNVRRLCAEAETSLVQMTRDLEMNRRWFYDILDGRANATFDTLARIADYFGVTVRDLLTEHRPSPSSK